MQVSATGSIRLSGTDASGDPSGIFAFTYGDGASGRVVLKATQVVVENSAEIVASSYGAGAGGDVEIERRASTSPAAAWSAPVPTAPAPAVRYR